jgi:hypothetical protein
MDSVIIHQPYIRQENGKIRLVALIERPNENPFELFYEVDDAYKEYLCYERSDAFLLGILEYAMYFGFNIECVAPVTERLCYQLMTYYIPVLSKNISYYRLIAIKGPLTSEGVSSQGAVGTGFSGGVDSYCTVLKHLKPHEESFALTHLICANAGAFTYAGGDVSKGFFEKYISIYQGIAKEMELPLISIHTNYMEFYIQIKRDPVCAQTQLKTGSCVHALQKLFGIYYFASAVTLDYFSLDENSPSFYDLFNLYTMSINTLAFHSSGYEYNRIQKVEYIADNIWAQKTLTACINYFGVTSRLNCGRCRKCIRTMMELYALDKLYLFSSVYDIEDFKKHLTQRIGSNLAAKEETIHGYNKEFIETARSNRVTIPFMAYMWAFFVYKPWYFITSKLRDYKLLRRIYYFFNIDVLRGGEIARKYRIKT